MMAIIIAETFLLVMTALLILMLGSIGKELEEKNDLLKKTLEQKDETIKKLENTLNQNVDAQFKEALKNGALIWSPNKYESKNKIESSDSTPYHVFSDDF